MITPDTRILITGCGGMLGDAVYKTFNPICTVRATDIDLNESWLTSLDVRDRDAMEKAIKEFRPEYVFHLAAFTDVEYCETHPDEAFTTNTLAVDSTAELCKKYDATMVYISTAGIFDGRQDSYTDYDRPRPLSVYAQAKYAGEVFIQPLLCPRYFIFRAGWMMGGGPKKDKKFVNKVIKQLKAGQRELFVVDDKLGTPTYTNNFAENMRVVIDADAYGLYNMVCDGSCSRLDVAKEMVNILGLEQKVKITKVDSSHWQKEYFAPRPPSEKLIDWRLHAKGLHRMRDWKECLRGYLESYDWGL